ncbi:hypothetical protein [Indioceanicola profundi]|uniref:hypothetical protein n=1 Tax=Indioceanicola profundi TaxID=2220096 RepID=UPI000E6A9E84|nr:hypothetical protein [Indioceanicola profundi]
MANVAPIGLVSLLLLTACASGNGLPRVADSGCPSGERYVQPLKFGKGDHKTFRTRSEQCVPLELASTCPSGERRLMSRVLGKGNHVPLQALADRCAAPEEQSSRNHQ